MPATQNGDAAERLLPLLARLQAKKTATIAGSALFTVPRGWAAEILREEASVKTVTTAAELEAAVLDEDTGSIFVPCDTFGLTLLERVLARNGLVKTIFWEE